MIFWVNLESDNFTESEDFQWNEEEVGKSERSQDSMYNLVQRKALWITDFQEEELKTLDIWSSSTIIGFELTEIWWKTF